MNMIPFHKPNLGWNEMPLNVLVEISKNLTSFGSDIAAMRETCRQWRVAIESLGVNLKPMGPSYHYRAFPNIVSIDLAARGQGPAVTPLELSTIANLAPKLQKINLSGAFQIVDDLESLKMCKGLLSLVLDDVPINELSTLLPHTASISSLSLRGCHFLNHECLESISSCTQLSHLDLTDCTLALHLHQTSVNLLSSMKNLRTLDLGGNSLSDASMVPLAQLPNLRALGLRDAVSLTEIGLAALADGYCAKHLVTLELDGCSGLGDGAWHVLGKFQGLKNLSLARLPALLQSAPMAEQHAAALWRWPHLLRLNLASSAVHPAKLKLLAAACGNSLEHLDINMNTNSSGSISQPYLNRLAPVHIRDLIESARSLRHLKSLTAARSGMPLEAIIAFMRAAQKLEHLDLSGCCLAPWLGRSRNSVVVSAGSCWWTSGMQIPDDARQPTMAMARSRSAVNDVSSALAGPGPEEFAAALGALHPTLRVLKLEDCSLSGAHLCHISLLNKIEIFSVAGNRHICDADMVHIAQAASSSSSSSPSILELDLSGTSITDAGLERLSKETILSSLTKLNLSRCSTGISSKGLESLAVQGGAGPSLRELYAADCAAIDSEGIGTLARAYPRLSTLSLAGCTALGSNGVVLLANSCSNLKDLDISRCGVSVDDSALNALCSQVTGLTRLNISGAHQVSENGISMLGKLSMLSDLDLTCCTALGKNDEDVGKLIEKYIKVANVELPQGSRGATGNILKRFPRKKRMSGRLTDF